jgi:multidrug efflux system outer membrane protein
MSSRRAPRYGLQNADRLPTVGVGVRRHAHISVSSSYSAGFVLSSFEIDLFGRVKSLSEAAAAACWPATKAGAACS